MSSSLVGGLIAAALAVSGSMPVAAAAAETTRMVGLVTDPIVSEISGFAASHQHADLLWTHNDSDDIAQIYALDTHGTLRASFDLPDARNIDWEDIALFQWQGRWHLLIADTGDNGGVRGELTLYIVAEPAQIADGALPIAWKQRFRWPDGARDCEAVAVDSDRGEILLISKKRVPAELFRLPLDPKARSPQTAERIGHLAGIQQPSEADLQRSPKYGRYRAQITAASISPDGRRMAVLNYRSAYLYSRRANETWTRALSRAPRPLPFPWLAQAEAITFSADGKALYVGTEQLPAPILRLALP